MKTVLFLEGETGTDFRDALDALKEMGYVVNILDNLYNDPFKLKAIPQIDPDFLFIGTTGIRKEEISKLTLLFKLINWTPRGVIFSDEHSAMVYLSIARDLKKKGTKFYFSPYDGEEKLIEIEWI